MKGTWQLLLYIYQSDGLLSICYSIFSVIKRCRISLKRKQKALKKRHNQILEIQKLILPSNFSFSRNICYLSLSMFLNSLPNDKFSDKFKLRAFADDKIKVIYKQKIILGLIKKREKEKMLVTSIFFFSHNVFKRLLFQGR